MTKKSIKELIKDNNNNNIRAYMISFIVLGIVAFISFCILLSQKNILMGVISLLLAILFLVLVIVLKVRANNVEWDSLTFEREKDFDLKLIYSDNYIAISEQFILFYKYKTIFKINDILFYFIDNNILKICIKDNTNSVYSYSFKYSNNNTLASIVNIINNKALDSNILYRDNYFIFSSNALIDINKISGYEVIILNTIKELIRTSQNEFVIRAMINGKDISGTYNYNDYQMCDHTFNYLANNCSGAKVLYSNERR